jgi:hypothetical protein
MADVKLFGKWYVVSGNLFLFFFLAGGEWHLWAARWTTTYLPWQPDAKVNDQLFWMPLVVGETFQTNNYPLLPFFIFLVYLLLIFWSHFRD